MPIRITAKKDGFRRANRAHGGTPTTYPDGTFTEEQLAALKAEPMLVVEELPQEAQGGPTGAPQPGDGSPAGPEGEAQPTAATGPETGKKGGRSKAKPKAGEAAEE